jgi:hypothetical protein
VIGGESGGQELAHNEVEMLDVASGTWKSLAPLQRGRHGTQAIYFDDMVVIGGGSGNRGGGPELNSFEVLAPNENFKIPAVQLIKGEISASTDEVIFNNPEKGSKKRIEIKNTRGNQAILLSYILLDNTEDFELQLTAEAPIVLAPGQILPIEIIYQGEPGDNPEALLLIKTLGESAPITIPIVIER